MDEPKESDSPTTCSDGKKTSGRCPISPCWAWLREKIKSKAAEQYHCTWPWVTTISIGLISAATLGYTLKVGYELVRDSDNQSPGAANVTNAVVTALSNVMSQARSDLAAGAPGGAANFLAKASNNAFAEAMKTVASRGPSSHQPEILWGLFSGKQAKVIIVAFWAVGPLAWFFVEYFFLFGCFGKRGPGDGHIFERYKHSQQLSAAIWIGLLAFLYAVAELLK